MAGGESWQFKSKCGILRRYMNTEQLLANWLRDYAATLPPQNGILRIRRAEPRFQSRDFFDRFKVEVAKFDGSGQNPTDITCVVVEVSVSDQKAMIAKSTECDSVPDL